MDSFEFNKIAGAVLAALLLMFGTPTLLGILSGGEGHGNHEAKAGYKLPEAAETAGHGGAAKEEKGFEFNKVAALFKSSSADAGKAVFKKCATCHTVNEGGKNGQGPNLYGIVGRKRGGHEGFKYSKAMTEKGGNWDYATLAEFVHKPKAYLSGTKMAFQGLSSDKDLANVLVYLQSLSASPVALPEAK